MNKTVFSRIFEASRDFNFDDAEISRTNSISASEKSKDKAFSNFVSEEELTDIEERCIKLFKTVCEFERRGIINPPSGFNSITLQASNNFCIDLEPEMVVEPRCYIRAYSDVKQRDHRGFYINSSNRVSVNRDIILDYVKEHQVTSSMLEDFEEFETKVYDYLESNLKRYSNPRLTTYEYERKSKDNKDKKDPNIIGYYAHNEDDGLLGSAKTKEDLVKQLEELGYKEGDYEIEPLKKGEKPKL